MTGHDLLLALAIATGCLLGAGIWAYLFAWIAGELACGKGGGR